MELIHNYLSNRKHHVIFDKTPSGTFNIDTVFHKARFWVRYSLSFMYINDICYVSIKVSVKKNCYTDDLTLYTKSISIIETDLLIRHTMTGEVI